MKRPRTSPRSGRQHVGQSLAEGASPQATLLEGPSADLGQQRAGAVARAVALTLALAATTVAEVPKPPEASRVKSTVYQMRNGNLRVKDDPKNREADQPFNDPTGRWTITFCPGSAPRREQSSSLRIFIYLAASRE